MEDMAKELTREEEIEKKSHKIYTLRRIFGTKILKVGGSVTNPRAQGLYDPKG